VRRALVLGAAACLCWGVVIFVTGGIDWSTPNVRLTSRDPFRPIVFAVLLVIGYWYVAPEQVARVARNIDGKRRHAYVVAAAAAAAVAVAGIVWGTRVAGGADTYGYLSQADLWRSGQLKVDQTFFEPWPYDDWTLAPLGYRPGMERRSIVPTYAPGLPILMAAADVAGSRARFLVVPLLGALAVWITFRLGTLLADEWVGAGACLLLAASPAFLYHAMWPMSDVPATAAWALALLLALVRRPFAAGAACSVAIALRPNLVFLALPLGLLAVSLNEDRRVVWRLGLFGLGVLPAVAGIAWLNTFLYGAPWNSGYGAATGLYRWQNLWTNAGRYSSWLVETETPLPALAIPALLSRRFSIPGTLLERPYVRFALGLFVTSLVVSYLLYEPFHDWTYVRFMLPALPVLLVAAVGLLRSSTRPYGTTIRVMTMMLVVVLVLAWEITTAQSHGAFTVVPNEERYEAIARDVETLTPNNGVVFAMQHSGSLRYYAHRMTVRYDWVPPAALDEAIALLAARDVHPYLLVESWELDRVRERFAGASPSGRLDWPPAKQWELSNGERVRLYDLQRARR
jgi:hypothetical protein